MRSFARWSILVVCLLLAFATAGIAGTPQNVQIQIRLQDAVGNPVPDGIHALILTGWNDSVGGTLLWTQNQMVTTKDGLSQCFIQSPAVAAMLAHSGQQYIQMQVAGEAPLVPRIQLGSVPSALLTTRMDGDIVTRPSTIHITNPGSGDPDFDLLRIAADSTGSSINMAGGDPDFDLLRVSAAASTGSITVGSGDPDFDLLRVTGSPSSSSLILNPGSGDPDFDLLRIAADSTGSSVAMKSITGDPDFDLLRITASDSTGKIAISGGDPDFDLLRITGNPSGSSMTMNGGGDPDFDLLRVSAAASTGSITVGSGDPDFDLLRITGSPSSSSVILNPGSGDPDFDLLRIAADSSGGSIAIGEEGVQRVHVTGGNGAAAISLNGLPPGTTGGGLISMEADSAQANIELTETTIGGDKLHIGSDPGGTGVPGSMGISIDEPGVHLSIDCRETTTGLDVEYRIGNDLDGDGVPDGAGIAIDEEGHQRLKAFLNNGGVVVVLDGETGVLGGKITMDADSTGGDIAIEEEGHQVVRIQSGTSGSGGGGGGGGGGEIAIGEEGVQIVRISSDSAASIMSVESGGVPGAVLTVSASEKKYNYFDAFPCGMRDVEIGTEGVTMSCTPGGTTTPDTAVQIDPAGHMRMAGDLSVGGDICAVGTIGACSDARYKTDVTQLEGALAQLARVRGVNFNWRTDVFPDKNFRADRDFGFIAQELKEVVPQVVTLGQDGYYSVDYGRLTPILVEAVKELDAKTRRIDELESRLAALEAQMMKLAAGVTTGEATLASSR